MAQRIKAASILSIIAGLALWGCDGGREQGHNCCPHCYQVKQIDDNVRELYGFNSKVADRFNRIAVRLDQLAERSEPGPRPAEKPLPRPTAESPAFSPVVQEKDAASQSAGRTVASPDGRTTVAVPPGVEADAGVRIEGLRIDPVDGTPQPARTRRSFGRTRQAGGAQP